MKRPVDRSGWALACAAALAMGGNAPARDGPPPSDRVRDAIRPFVDRGEVAGVVTLVGDAGAIQDAQSIGRRDLENDLPMRPDTIFRVASMTKPIAAIGIMILVEEGKVGLDDPVETHLPEFRGQKMVTPGPADKPALQDPPRPITLRDLLTHTSGLPDKAPPGGVDTDSLKNPTMADAVKVFATRPISSAPGTRWAYSNSGITTLGRIIEVASGKPFDLFLQERLFGPLGMVDTTFYPTPDQLKRTAVTYDRKDGKLVEVGASRVAPRPESRYPSPAGGLYATAADLARLYRMMLQKGTVDGRRYLTEASVAEMTRLQTGAIPTGFVDGMGYGLGWGYVREPKGVTEALSPGTFGHGGAWGTQGWIDPKRGTFAILLIQRAGLGNGDASEIRRALQRAVFP